MAWIISTALKFRVLVVAFAIALIVFGVRTARDIPLDVFPEFAPPYVEVQTEVPGISTEEVESLVTVPLENALNGVPFVTTIRSTSVLGLSSVRLIFAQGTNVLTARQLVEERLALAATRLPTAARQPVILPPLSSLSRAMKIGLWSDTMSQMDMTVLAKWTIRPRLTAIQGVANVAIWGEKDREFQVLVDPDRLRAHGLTLDALVAAVQQSTLVGSGGFVDTPNQRIVVRHVPPIYDAEDLAATTVAFRNGASLALGDVAEVTIGHSPPIGDAVINDRLGIMLIVEKEPSANTLDVTREVEAAMDDLQPGLGDMHVDTTIFRPATFIERAITNLTRSMLIGCVLVVVVLVFFLYDWRAALISSTAIPLSLVTAALVLAWYGNAINTMVLAGLVIALGEVVDDAIIDVENIVRRLRLNRQLDKPRGTFRVVLEASLEVRSAVVYASLIVILAFLPVFFLEGLAGSFFRPLALAYATAIFASLVVALTVTPALSFIMLPSAAGRRRDAPLVRGLKAVYRSMLPAVVEKPGLATGLMAALAVAGAITVPFLGQELLPKFKETDFLMHWVEKPGIGIDAMNRITLRASNELRSIPGVRNFGAHIGRAAVADEVVGPNFTELWISIDDEADYAETVAQVQEVVDGYPGLYRDLLTYLSERIKEVLTGTSASVVVRVFGDDLEGLRESAEQVAAEIGQVDGVTTLKVEPQTLVPQVVVRLRPEAAARFGLTTGQTLGAATTLVNGTQVGEVYQDQKIFAVVVRGVDDVRRDVRALRELMIDTPAGAQVPLAEVADVYIEPTPSTVHREAASRRIDVTCNVAGRDLGSVAEEIEQRVRENVAFAPGYHPEFLGEYAEAQASRRRMLTVGALALIGMILLLYVDFQSSRTVAIVVVTIPLALVGGAAGAWLAGGVLSLGSFVGFVTVLGIAARNAIMLLGHYRHLEQEEGMTIGAELVMRGAEERLAPILMTATTTGLALLPLVVSGNLPGNEIEYPMAFVILGGLVTSTMINLLVVPGLYSWVYRPATDWDGRHARNADGEADEVESMDDLDDDYYDDEDLDDSGLN